MLGKNHHWEQDSKRTSDIASCFILLYRIWQFDHPAGEKRERIVINDPDVRVIRNNKF